MLISKERKIIQAQATDGKGKLAYLSEKWWMIATGGA